jgi:hypothetical protein
VVSWTTHNLLSPDWDRWLAYHGTKEAMNGALSMSSMDSDSGVAVRGGRRVDPDRPQARLLPPSGQHPIPDPKEAVAACDTKRHRLVSKGVAEHIHNRAAIP